MAHRKIHIAFSIALLGALAAAPAFGAQKKAAPAKKAGATPTPTPTPANGLDADQQKALKEAQKDKKTGPADAALFAGDVDSSPEWFKKTDEVIAQLTDLIKTLPDGDVKATRMIQLAELYWEKASRLHLRSVKQYNKVYDDWFMKNGAEKGIPEPKLDDSQSDAVMNKAVAIYEYVIKKYPNNPMGDQAHYYLGQSYLQLAKKDQAVNTFKKLVERYPKSQFIPDAYLGLGEFFFENKKVDDAIEWYGKATQPQYKMTKNWGYARYKLAWAYENKGDYRGAVNLFKEVVQYSIDAEKNGTKLEYKEQALKDLVTAYAEVGNVDEAEGYFHSISGGQDYYRKFLELFGAQLFAQGRDDESIAVYRKLVALDPMSSSALTYEGEILKAHMRKADRPAVLAQLQRIVAMVKPDSPWVQHNQGEMEKIQSERDALESSVAKYAREVFEEGRKLSGDQQLKDFQQAEQFCDYYLQTFPNVANGNSYRLRMMIAEVQYKSALSSAAPKDPKWVVGKLTAAQDNYLKVAEQDAPKGTENFRALAAEDAIFAADEIFKRVPPSKRPDPTDHTPRDIPDLEKNVVLRPVDAYIKYVPKGPKIIPVRYRGAYLAYEFNQFDDAVKRFQDVIDGAPGTEQGRLAADLILNIFETKNDPASVNAYAKKFLKIQALASQHYTDKEDNQQKDYHRELQSVIERSSMKMVQALEQQQKFADAAVAYLQFTKDYPTSNLAETAYYNASVAFEKGEKVDEAIKVREEFIKKYPNSDHTPDVILYLGDNYRKTTDFSHASDYYELLAEKHPKFKSSCDALYNAGFFRENLGETQKAIGDYRAYMKQCADHADTHEVLFTIAELYEKKKDVPNATKTYDEYIKTFGAKKSPDNFLDAKARIATMTYDAGKKKDAYMKYADITTSYKGLVREKAKIGPIGLGAAAKAAFYTVEPKFEEYESLKLTLPQKKLASDIKKKLAYIKPLRGQYENVVLDYKHGDWAVASLYQIGLLAEDFVKAVKEAPIPPEVKTDDQKQLYVLDLQDMFQPVEDTAVEYYTKCLNTSYEYKIYSEYTRKAMEGLERINAAQYGKDPEMRLAAGTQNTSAFESSPLLEVK